MRLARMNNEEVKLDYNYDDFENFSALEGSLNWPVKSGKIRRNFGENRNEKLNTVTLNYGVDIETPKEEEVYAVAEGIVSAVEWIPGYGSVIILTHKNNYRTVYGHLSEIHINEGDKVNGGTLYRQSKPKSRGQHFTL
ncbi:MAG: M23 family metallopeptidase [Melioribacteraceae bacterium]|nr:M23 family metallopeptidase [Melioribacteraceae bacterium]